jgi:aspartyl-tRNA synthetase
LTNIEKPQVIRDDRIRNQNLLVSVFVPKEKDLEEVFFDENNFSVENENLRNTLISLWEKAKETKSSGKDIGDILTTQYDLVLNGFEAGGGSIRNHQSEALKKVFEIMGFTEEQIQVQFGHMLQAFEFGAPPHGGIALGLDRVIAILANEPNIREVIAFPKTGDARDLMMGAPSEVSEKALREVHIKLDIKK